MGGSWITQAGATGSIQIVDQEGDWFLEEPSSDGAVKYVFQGEFDLSEDATQTVDIRVSKYMQAADQGPDYLFAAPNGGETSTEREQSDENTEATSATASRRRYEKRSLSELSGSGDYVTIEAIVDKIHSVNKDKANMPDIIGVLRAQGGSQKRMFVVNDNVNHPYLEEDRMFEFRNVKDHYYDKADNIQVMITQRTQYMKKEFVKTTADTSSTQSSTTSSSSTSSSSNQNLDQIAQSMVDEALTVDQDDESAVGKAKKKAKRQGRDPAIDPTFNDNE